jgi:hypothetical protein
MRELTSVELQTVSGGAGPLMEEHRLPLQARAPFDVAPPDRVLRPPRPRA